VFVVALATASTGLAAAERRTFTIAADAAEKSLRKFSTQSGLALIFPSELTRGIHTSAVNGTFTPREALDRLLAGSGIVAIEDPQTGAITLTKAPRSTPSAPAQPPTEKTLSVTQTKPAHDMLPAKKTTLWAALAATLFASQLDAQTAAKLATEEETLVLSPFTVSTEKDTGYQAIDSLAGGRMATNVLKTPADQTILTREFLDDIAAINYIDAGRWLPNATIVPSGGIDFGQGVTFRGVSPAGYPYRNYFRSLGPVDDYIVERLDSARGPNALIFADGVIGGIINTNTKRAQFGRPRNDVKLRLDSEGSHRGALDIGRKITERIALRTNLVAEKEKRYNQFEQQRLGAQLALSFRPWPKTEIRIEGEAQDLSVWGSTTSRFADQVSTWNGIKVVGDAANPILTTGAYGNGVGRQTTDKIVYSNGFGSAGPLNMLNFGNTQGSGIGISTPERSFNVKFPVVDRTFQFLAPNAPSLQRQVSIGAYFEKEISERAAFEVAVHRSRQDRTTKPGTNAATGNYWIDVNAVLPNGAPNPKFRDAYTESNADQSSGDNRNTDLRAAAVYAFPTQSFKQRINILAGWREEDFAARTERYARSNGTNPDMRQAVNLTILRRYFSDGSRQDVTRPSNGQNGYNFDWVRTQDRLQKQELRNIQGSTVGSYFGDRLNVIAGMGYYLYKQYQKDIASVGPNGQPTGIAYSAITTPISNVRSSIGAVYFPIKAIGVYVNQSSSFTPVTSGDPDLNGKQFDPTDGQGLGFGLRGNLLGGKITGSAGYYDSSEKNRVTNFSSGEINSIWNSLAKTVNQIPTTQYRDRLDYKASGYEAEVTANPTKALRLFANISFPKTSQTNTIRGTRAYFAAHIDEWQKFADDPANTNVRTNILNQITTLRARLDAAAEGRALNGTQKYTANIFANYTIQRSALKGLRLGTGANFIGRRLIGNQLNKPFDFYYGEARHVVTATAGYDFKVRKIPVNVQLNVSNVLDYSRPVFTGSATNAVTNNFAVGNGYYYEDPRKFTLVTQIKF
jgi:iron complex outermembrane receptor protein